MSTQGVHVDGVVRTNIYNVYPIGCFFNDVHYDEATSTVMLALAEGVYVYQQVAVVISIIISLTLIFAKVFHICLAVTHHNQIDGPAAPVELQMVL